MDMVCVGLRVGLLCFCFLGGCFGVPVPGGDGMLIARWGAKFRRISWLRFLDLYVLRKSLISPVNAGQQ
jgi:hypothetical protein